MAIWNKFVIRRKSIATELHLRRSVVFDHALWMVINIASEPATQDESQHCDAKHHKGDDISRFAICPDTRVDHVVTIACRYACY
jgi:hypothetical protein